MRNWDYRFCWLRDAILTLLAMLNAGYREEARRGPWLRRAIAGDPADLQIMYGIGGERRLDERELEWLPGYERSTPVRVGNAASEQLQLDVYGEVLDADYQSAFARRREPDDKGWSITLMLLEWLEDGWRETDAGIWEMRGPRASLHLLEGDGLGRVRPRGAPARRVRRAGAGRLAGASCETRSTPRCSLAPGATRSRPSRSRTARTSSMRASC